MHQHQQHEGGLRRADRYVWRRVAIQTGRDLWASNVLEWASTLAFYSILSLFPLIITSLIAVSYLADTSWASEQTITLVSQFIPEGEAHIEEIVTSALEQRQRVGVISFIVLMLTGRRILGALTKGLDHVSDVDPLRDPLARRAGVELALAAGLFLLGVAALAAGPLLELAGGAVQVVPGPDSTQMAVLRDVVRVPLFLTCFALVYAVVPRGKRQWRAVLVGAGLATLLLLVAQAVFLLLVDQIWEGLNLIYGPVAFAALLMWWAWYVALITLIGGGLASHVKVMLIERAGAGETERRHIAITKPSCTSISSVNS